LDDIEITTVNIIYDATSFLLELNFNNEVTLLQIYSYINKTSKYLLALLLINNDQVNL